jgi:tetratricopeptide (TPR) repeat protein
VLFVRVCRNGVDPERIEQRRRSHGQSAAREGKAMKILRILAAGLFGVALAAQPSALIGQENTTTGSIHGHVTNPAGEPVTNGEVRLTTDRTAGSSLTRKYEYTFPLDAQGNYKGTDIKPGNYVGVVFQQGNSVDFNPNATVAAGEDKAVDFDMTRKEYLDKMSPADKAKLEAYKKQNSAAQQANAKIANLNTLLKEARDATKAGDYAGAIKAMNDATTAKPDEPLLWDTLGDAQLGEANAAEKAAKANHTTDASVPGKFDAAIASYQKAVDLNSKAAKPNPELAATADNQLGQAYGKVGKTKEAADAYNAAATADPPKAGMYFFNEAATLFNAGDTDAAAAAADKAIAADPTKADAYYIKGQALIGKATVDPKTNTITAPPGCVEAYQKYLELDPTGPRAEEVKGILQGIGQQVETKYKAGSKKK